MGEGKERCWNVGGGEEGVGGGNRLRRGIGVWGKVG